MMKKLTKAMLLAAATAFLLANFPACSSDDDDPTLNQIKIRVDESRVKTTYTVGEEFDLTGIMVAATYNDGGTKDVTAATDLKVTCNGEPFTTAAEEGDIDVTITATYEGKTDSVTRTIKFEDSKGEEDETIKINFNANDLDAGDITADKAVSATFTIHATSSAAWAVDTNSKTMSGISYTKRLKSSGERTRAKNAALEFTNVKAGTYTIDMMGGGSGDRTLTITEGDNSVIFTKKTTDSSTQISDTFTVTTDGATLWIETDKAINIYGIHE